MLTAGMNLTGARLQQGRVHLESISDIMRYSQTLTGGFQLCHGCI